MVRYDAGGPAVHSPSRASVASPLPRPDDAPLTPARCARRVILHLRSRRRRRGGATPTRRRRRRARRASISRAASSPVSSTRFPRIRSTRSKSRCRPRRTRGRPRRPRLRPRARSRPPLARAGGSARCIRASPRLSSGTRSRAA